MAVDPVRQEAYRKLREMGALKDPVRAEAAAKLVKMGVLEDLSQPPRSAGSSTPLPTEGARPGEYVPPQARQKALALNPQLGVEARIKRKSAERLAPDYQPTSKEIDLYRRVWLGGDRPESRPAEILARVVTAPENRWPKLLAGLSNTGRAAIKAQARSERDARAQALKAQGAASLDPANRFMAGMMGSMSGGAALTMPDYELAKEAADRTAASAVTGVPAQEVGAGGLFPTQARRLQDRTGFGAGVAKAAIGLTSPSAGLDFLLSAPLAGLGRGLNAAIAAPFAAQALPQAIEAYEKGDVGGGLAAALIAAAPILGEAGPALRGPRGRGSIPLPAVEGLEASLRARADAAMPTPAVRPLESPAPPRPVPLPDVPALPLAPPGSAPAPRPNTLPSVEPRPLLPRTTAEPGLAHASTLTPSEMALLAPPGPAPAPVAEVPIPAPTKPPRARRAPKTAPPVEAMPPVTDAPPREVTMANMFEGLGTALSDNLVRDTHTRLTRGEPMIGNGLFEQMAERAYKRGYTAPEDVRRAMDLSNEPGTDMAQKTARFNEEFPVKADVPEAVPPPPKRGRPRKAESVEGEAPVPKWAVTREGAHSFSVKPLSGEGEPIHGLPTQEAAEAVRDGLNSRDAASAPAATAAQAKTNLDLPDVTVNVNGVEKPITHSRVMTNGQTLLMRIEENAPGSKNRYTIYRPGEPKSEVIDLHPDINPIGASPVSTPMSEAEIARLKMLRARERRGAAMSPGQEEELVTLITKANAFLKSREEGAKGRLTQTVKDLGSQANDLTTLIAAQPGIIRDVGIVVAARMARGGINGVAGVAKYLDETFGPGSGKHAQAVYAEAQKALPDVGRLVAQAGARQQAQGNGQRPFDPKGPKKPRRTDPTRKQSVQPRSGDPVVRDLIEKLPGYVREARKNIKGYGVQQAERAQAGDLAAAEVKARGGTPAQQAVARAAASRGEYARRGAAALGLPTDKLDHLHGLVESAPNMDHWGKLTAHQALTQMQNGERIPPPSALAELGRALGDEFVLASMKAMPWPTRIKEYVQEAIAIQRTIRYSLDRGAILRQTGKRTIRTLFTNPAALGRTYVRAERAAFSRKSFEAMENEIRNRTNGKEYEAVGLRLSDLSENEQFGSRVLRNLASQSYREASESTLRSAGLALPRTIAKVTANSERFHTAYTNLMRVETYDKMAHAARRAGFSVDANPEVFQRIAGYANVATGTADLGALEKYGEALTAVFNAPRYQTARLMDNPVGWAKLPAGARREALVDAAVYWGAVAAGLAAAEQAGAKVAWNPQSQDFGKIVIGQKRIDITGGATTWLRFFVQTLAGQNINTKTGVRTNFATNKVLDPVYDATTRKLLPKTGVRGKETTAGRAGRELRYKVAPAIDVAITAGEGKNAIGVKQTPATMAKSTFAPISVENIAEAGADKDTLGLVLMIPDLIGASQQDYGKREQTRN